MNQFWSAQDGRKNTPRIARTLEINDRRGERLIALFQAAIGIIVIAFHLFSSFRNQWQNFSVLTVSIAACIILACLLRLRLATNTPLPSRTLHLLAVLDGILIYLLIISYSVAYGLPVESSFKAPSIVFLMVYTCVRVLKLDPIAIYVSGATVLAGWFGLLAITLTSGAEQTNYYADYITANKVLVGAYLEMAAGYLAVVIVLALAVRHARGILANTADIEELKAANIEAERSTRKLTAMLESSTDGVIIVDEAGTIQQVNNALETMFGHEQASLTGKSAALLMSPENAALLRADIEQFQNQGDSRLVGQPYASTGVRKNGDTFPIELSINGFETDGKLNFAGFIRDITERQRLAERERVALARFQDVVQSALDAIVVIDEQGKVVEFNPAAEAMFGYRREDAVGREMAELIVPEHHRSLHRDGMKKYLATGIGPVLDQRIEIDAIRADGATIMTDLAIKVFEGDEGKLFFGYLRDITQRKADEKALVEAKENAEIANRAKASFLAMMSHEIRTPLNGVLGILSLLGDSDIDKEQSRLVATARRSGKVLLTIINDILDFSKLEAGKFDLEMSPFHTDVLIDSVHSLVRHQADGKGIALTASIDDAAPPVLLGDQDRIRQVLLNLAWNSVKFTERGSVSIRLERRDGDTYRFIVKDTGIGIPEDRHEELFKEFATLDANYAKKFGGTGLGLAICKALTEAMGGSIGFSSKPEKGSVFWFDLELETSTSAPAADEGRDEPEPGTLAKTRVLLAEDNATNQMVLSHMLERMGCTVDIVGNGLEAVDGVRSRDYDVVLMDISMPEMDGIEATRMIRKLSGPKGAIPVIALTAYALDEDRQRVLSSGLDDFVSKPVSVVELARAISRQLAQAGDDADAGDALQLERYFDRDKLDALLAEMDADFRQKVLAEFRRDLTSHAERIDRSLDDKDADTAERATHSLKGVAAAFGADALSRMCETANLQLRQFESLEGLAEIARLARDIAASLETYGENVSPDDN